MMARRNILKTCFYALGAGFGFGAGVAIRLGLPRASETVVLILEKLGFEWNDLLLYLVDPDDTYNARKPKKRRKPPTRVSKKRYALAS